MRIGMVVKNRFRPDVRIFKEAQTLISQGHQVHVVAVQENAPAKETIEGVHVRRLPIHSFGMRSSALGQWLRYIQFTLRAAQVSSAWRPDICHVHDVTALLPGYLASRWCHCPLIYDAHEFEAGRQEQSSTLTPGVHRWMWTLPERLLIDRTAAVITVSGSIADGLATRYSIPRPAVIRNVPEWEEIPRSSTLRTTLHIAPDEPILLYQGWLMRGRGLEQIIRSLLYLEHGVAVIIGGGLLADELKALATSLGVAERVHFTGRIEPVALPSYTSSADIGLHLLQNTCLNHNYALPNKVFEYMRAGLPMVVGDTLEMKRLVEAEDVGLATNPESPQAIAEAVRSIWSDQAGYTRMSANGLRAARERHNWQLESRKLLELYARVLDGSAAAVDA